MNRKAQYGPIGFVFAVLVFLIVWGMFLGTWLVEVGQTAITEQHLTGIEAFTFANLNLIVLIGLIMGTMAYFYFAGGA